MEVMKLHEAIQSGVSTTEGEEYSFTDLCTVAGG